ncbi:MAG: hypothetical protein P1V81_08265 [Planctomycetota bacterium]|nr:hypothetical protein [Planctomycetota bacterium]
MTRTLAFGLLALALLAPFAAAQVPTVSRIDVTPTGGAPNGIAHGPTVSADGNFVVFASRATDLVATTQPVAGGWNLFRRNVRTGVTEQVNLDNTGAGMPLPDGTAPLAPVTHAISGNGRHVVFTSLGAHPTLGDPNPQTDVYLRDLGSGTTELISAGFAGPVQSSAAQQPTVSDDGRYVAFLGIGNEFAHLQAGLTALARHAYVRDRVAGATFLVSRSTPVWSNSDQVRDVQISGDGSRVGFLTFHGTTGSGTYLHVYEAATKTTRDLAQVAPANPFAELPTFSMSRTGSKIALGTTYDGLVPGDQDGTADVFLLDLTTGLLEQVNTTTQGATVLASCSRPSLSPDGRYVTFESLSAELPAGPPPAHYQVYVKDLLTGLTTLGSHNFGGEAGALATGLGYAKTPSPRALSDLGGALVFQSDFENIASPATPGQMGIFHNDRSSDGPQLTVDHLVVGATAKVVVTGAQPGGAVLLAISVTGQGPYSTTWGPADVSPPLHTQHMPVDAFGTMTLDLPIVPALVGLPIYVQGLDTFALALTSSYYGVVQ